MIYLLPHTISNSAKRFPDREAFRCGNAALTYRQMERRMNQVAGVLHEANLQKGDRVGIYLNRCIETAIAMYGIMQAGGVYVPIDPKAPVSRSRFLIEDCGIKILISQPAQKRHLAKVLEAPSNVHTLIGLNEEREGINSISWETVFEHKDQFTLPFRLLEKDLAYIIYTSGSTGQPKGIMHTHYSGLSYARLSAEVYDLNEKDRIGNHAPIHFDISTLGYFTSPFVGACSVIVSDAHTIFPASLADLIEKEALTVWYSVPLALIQLLQNKVLDNKKITQLRWLLYGGEPFPPKYIKALMEHWPTTRFCNVYGPAEVNQCTYYHLPGPPQLDESIPIGKVWKNTDFLIINEEDQPVDQGETGELLIRSATQMKGYWGNPELTDQSLYKQITDHETLLFYRTGDLVKIDQHNQMHFLGRKDFQVKIRGHRVELDAVEASLMTHNSVSEAAVYAIQATEESKQIAAAVILKPTVSISTEELTNFLKTQLPMYAVPEKITFVKDFPRTTSGKIKRSMIASTFSNNND